MDRETQSEYRALVRGAATWILVGKKNLASEALELANLYHLDPALVRADIDALVQAEQAKKGGVFELPAEGRARQEEN